MTVADRTAAALAEDIRATRRPSARVAWRDLFWDAVLVVALLVFAAPIAWMILLAFQTDRAIISAVWEFYPTLTNLTAILSPSQPLRAQTLNSVIIVAGTVLLCGGVSTLAGYSLSKLRMGRWLNWAIGASCAFLTPIGHQNNLLVMGPGGYRFGDYWRVGLPLEILIVAIATLLLPRVWPF